MPPSKADYYKLERMKLTYIYTLILSLLLSGQVLAQFQADAELRTRGEVYHGYKALATKGQDAGVSISQRTRLNFGYKSKWTDLYVSLQDVRIWGNNPQLTIGSGGTTWLHQAYAVGKMAKWVDIKLGRQEIVLDDHRIFGNVGWAQQARSHDAAILRFKPDSNTKVWIGGAFNQSATQLVGTLYTTPNNYKTMQFLWVNRSFGNIKASLLFLNNGLQVNTTDSLRYQGESGVPTTITYTEKATYFSQTAGIRAGYDGKKFKAFGAFYYQFGHNGAFRLDSTETATTGKFEINRVGLNAMLARIDLLGKLGPVTVTAGYEYQSGNSQITPSDHDQAFSPLYGTNHKFNGFMDYFYVGNHAKSVGLHDAFLGAKFTHKKFFVSATAHHFLAANHVNDSNNLGVSMKPSLGTELDVLIGYNFNDELSVLAGYSNMWGTSTMEELRGGDKDALSNWAFLMVTFKPVLFNSQKFKKE